MVVLKSTLSHNLKSLLMQRIIYMSSLTEWGQSKLIFQIKCYNFCLSFAPGSKIIFSNLANVTEVLGGCQSDWITLRKEWVRSPTPAFRGFAFSMEKKLMVTL